MAEKWPWLVNNPDEQYTPPNCTWCGKEQSGIWQVPYTDAYVCTTCRECYEEDGATA